MFRKFLPFEASASYVFKDPDTGHRYQSNTLQGLTADIINYRFQNQLEPIENLNLVIENYLCGLPENTGKCCLDERIDRDFYTVIKGGLALLKNLRYKKYCTLPVADERAKQCIACPNNVFPDKGPFMAWSDDIAIKIVGDRRSTYHNELGNCLACTCPLRSKIFWGEDTMPPFKDSEVKEMEKVNCWQLPFIKKGK